MQSPPVPKIIHALWLQGVDAAPDLVRLNLDRWARMNPDYRMNVADAGQVALLLEDFPLGIDRLSPQALSDIVRARLLSRDGGVWVDASVFPTRPLGDWLPSAMTASGFFAFEKPGPDRPLSSWFLAVTPDNPLMLKWWERVRLYWSVERSPHDGIPEDPVTAVEAWHDRFPYFWFHYLFQALVDRDPECADIWASCTKWSADAPHALQIAFAQHPDPDVDAIARIIAAAPLHKLNWRSLYPIERLRAL